MSTEHSELRWDDPKEVKNYFSFDRQVESIDKFLFHNNCFNSQNFS
ncbi:MAG: hypothetical protein GPJ54_08680 [Candidatus Heimdallarchaeota archaeon]|nr:hypothetical protein [Candidatus Heimdallarchaeota archaeon]